MEKVITTGKTVDEAVNDALTKLGTSIEHVNVKVIEQPGKRLFGIFGVKEAVIEVTKISPEDSPESEEKSMLSTTDSDSTVEQLAKAKQFLEEVFQSMNMDVMIEQLRQKDYVLFNIVGSDLGILIGRRGQTLDSLQYLVNIVANRYSPEKRVHIVLDAENYRSRRKATLENLAAKLADKVLRTGKEVVLEPMTPLERKIIHTKLQNHPRVQTYSRGEEPYRKVIITKK